MTSQIAFDFEPPAKLCAKKAARARDAVARYRSLTSDDDITGRETDIIGLLRRRPMQEPARHVAPEQARRPSPGLPPARFHMPRPPVGRPRTADGQQSFHFELTTVTKGVDGACRTNDGRAADPVAHVGYVGREEAVAVEVRAEVHEAIAHVGYVARDTAVALDGEGAAIIETNIDGDPADFFATVLAYEDLGHPDRICLVERFDPIMLHDMMQKPDMPPALKTALERIMADREAHRVEKSGKSDSYSKSRTHPFQVDADVAGCAAWLNEHAPHGLVHLRKGRGGIVQRRITGELPAKFGPERCRRVLKKLGVEFERRGLRYYVALHAPTAANNDRNWHFHLLYYDRPCDRIDGEWDFSIAMEKRTSSRNRTRSYPHRQKKCAEVAHRDWPMHMRERFAAAVNVELEAIGSQRRYDPRSYVAMGIDAEPQDHLTRRPAFIAACGAAPARDIENARKGWSARLVQLLKRHEQIEKDDEARVAGLRITVGETPKKRATLAELERELAERRAEARTADVLVRILHPMARSNAEQTAKKMRGHAIDLADKQRAAGKDPADHHRHEEFKQREREAHAYLDGLEKTFAPDIKFAHALMVDAQLGRERIETEFKILHDQAVWTRAHTAMTVPSPMQRAAARERTVHDATPPPIVTAEPASPPALPVKIPSDAEKLPSADVDDWLARIRSHRRRIVRRDDRTEPFKINDLDRRMLDMASPEQLKELDRVRDRQNRLIRRIVAAVEAAPGILIIPDDPNGKWTLGHRDRDLQDGLRCYIADPSVQDQLRTARETGLALQSGTRQVPPQVHRAIDEISRAVIAVQRHEDGLAVRTADAARLGITLDDLKQPAAQRRLDGIRQTQDERSAPIVSPDITVSPRVDDRPSQQVETPVPAAHSLTPAPAKAAKPSIAVSLPKNDLRSLPANAQVPAASPPAPVLPKVAASPRPAAADTCENTPDRPPVAVHPLIASWQEAHQANLRPGGAITVRERNRRAAMALGDTVATDELWRLGPAILNAVTAQAAENQRQLQRNAGRSAQHPTLR